MHVLIVLLSWIFITGFKNTGDDNTPDKVPSWGTQTPIPTVDGHVSFSLTPDNDYINVMESAMPKIPNYPPLTAKAGKLRGFVADLSGKPLADAFIGLRSAGTVYIAASAETDANGYYEIPIPLGGADLWAAGYTIDYGSGRAALSLYPTDGRTALSNSGAGIVKNFVLLSYGLASANERAEKPWSSGGYFGGSLRFNYSLYDNMWTPKGLPEGSEVVIRLTPQVGTTFYGETRSFTIKRTIGNSNGNFVVNNIPIGTYQIQAALADGRIIKMHQSGPYVSLYPHQGLQPRTATGTAKVLFTPMGVENNSANANYGGWRPVDITLELN
ncbi:MAG TPA: carboxypeptidase-like regulatory domain-containing protein [Flavisolibacter sp.]|jgi:hypothetical protein|nr:carboxypeptidase-like regulatory domain-containing protein [Flavisolibacter sp.]